MERRYLPMSIPIPIEPLTVHGSPEDHLCASYGRPDRVVVDISGKVGGTMAWKAPIRVPVPCWKPQGGSVEVESMDARFLRRGINQSF